MADGLQASCDTQSVLTGLDRLAGPLATSLARSMGVAGGQVLRDEAKQLAPVKDGLLRDSIYLAFKEAWSNSAHVTYSVTWNAKKAPHGHLVEFGHWQPYVVRKLDSGEWVTTKILRKVPAWTPAHPFLRPALNMAGDRARQAMLERGRVRLPELLAGQGSTDEP